jgi:indole-3-glycerol phosphate synthase
MPTYLDAILEAHREAARLDRRDPDELLGLASGLPPARDLATALRAPGLSVIAEIKRHSPSRGILVPDLDPARWARAYHTGGAAAVSVLTDAAFFAGSPEDLRAARQAVPLPVLRKDFTVSALDVLDARLMGADAVLLIVAALADSELAELGRLAVEVGLCGLFEVHDEAELDRALAAGAGVVGVNQRDLSTFEVDTERALRVGASMPASVVRVAESGVKGPEAAGRLADAGFDAVLVGESLVTAPDPAGAVLALRQAGADGPRWAPLGRS